ncbi:sortase A [Evansella vedderi]|uniref:Sortase A n=1 Tax=Evansella vedderi TaxID=38282 RepID=A0ABT9ZZN9_9BACI|nr:class D sortase [Evansella vedderi]MDQ0256702.1 sortase A [Evansella vedderi]
MNKLLIVVIVIGLSVSGYSGFQWYEGRKAVKNIAAEEVVVQAKPIKQLNKNREEISFPDIPIMSDEMSRFYKGEEMAELRIPVIGKSYSVYWGTDDDTLDQGVGMYVSEWTTTPDQLRHTVVSGHRDTVFRELGDVKEGDEITVVYDGVHYIYEVKDIWITDAEDRTVIVRKDNAILTLTTCYPFNFIGNAPDRYIIQAELIGKEI